MSKLRPLCNELVVRRLKNESVTTSSIILSQSSLELSNKGEVLAVGVEVVDIKEQDIVLFNMMTSFVYPIYEEGFENITLEIN